MTGRLRIGLVALGLAGLYVYLRFLAHGGHLLTITPPLSPPDFLFISAAESRLMLLHSLVALPSAVAISVGLSQVGAAALTRQLDRYAASSPKQHRTAAIAFGLILFSLFRVGRTLVLRDLPVTDDENAIDFGAQILASGALTAPVLPPEGAFLDLFLHTKAGQTTSFDWPGGLLFRALALKTGLGDYAYAACAALGGTAVVASIHRALGPRAGLLGAAAFIASPLALGISLTAHPHLVARTFIALAVWAYLAETMPRDAARGRPGLRGALLGAAIGTAMLCRPFESAALLGPLSLHVLWRARAPSADARRFAMMAALATAAAVVVFAAYNLGTTGSAWLPTRFDRAHIDANFLPPMSLDERIVNHVGHNLPLLAVYVLGALGLPVALLGMLVGPRPLLMLGLGFIASLGLMLGHSNVGIHTVGPIHYAESVVPLTILFVAGLQAVAAKLATVVAAVQLRAAAIGYVVLGVGGLFCVPWLAQLQRHGEFVARPHDFLDAKQIHNAIVLCPQFPAMRTPDAPGTWQLSMPHPDPYLRDDVVCALPTADPDALHATYPQRHIYRLVPAPGGSLALLHLHAPR